MVIPGNVLVNPLKVISLFGPSVQLVAEAVSENVKKAPHAAAFAGEANPASTRTAAKGSRNFVLMPQAGFHLGHYSIKA